MVFAWWKETVDRAREQAQTQILFNGWRDELYNLATYEPDAQLQKIGFEGFLLTLTVGSLWMGLPPEVGEITLINGKTVQRYSEQNPAPEGIELQNWSLGNVDFHFGKQAKAKGITYPQVFSNSNPFSK